MSIYTRVEIKKPQRNVFNLSHKRSGCLNIGELRLIARPIECVPGDTFITGNITRIDMSPIVNKFDGNLYFETWQFYVTNDMLYNPQTDSGKFTDILLSLSDPQNILSLPYNSIPSASSYSIFSQLYGLKKNHGSISVSKHLSSYPVRAMLKIINEWFRDENLEPEYTSLTQAIGNGLFYHINYKKDRYTSATLTTQKGIELKFNLGRIAIKYDFNRPSSPLWATTTTSPTSTHALLVNPNAGVSNSSMVINTGSGGVSTTQANEIIDRLPEQLANNMYADGSTAGFTINDLRLYDRLQKWQERNLLCGTRIKEYLLSNYGIAPNDETLERPIIIGHTKTPVIIDEVTSNITAQQYSGSDSNQKNLQNSRGSRGGIAGTSSIYSYGKWTCKEFGWIITLGALRPYSNYVDGIHPSLRKSNVVDYFNPIFQHLGLQPVRKSEIFFSNDSTDDEIWGYQDIYNDMRHLEDCTDDDLLNIYPTAVMCRKFANRPALSRDFIEVKPSEYDYLFNYDHTVTPHAFFYSNNIIKAIRPIAKRSKPAL